MTLKEEIEKKHRYHNYWYLINRIIGHYSKAFSIIISISVPVILLLDTQATQTVIILSLIGMLLAIIPLIFRIDFHIYFDKEIVIYARDIIRKYDNKELNDKDLINALEKIDKLELEEVEH